MPKHVRTFFFLLLLCSSAFGQLKPDYINLPGDENYFSKITSSNPVSNSILDIITIDDSVVWLGTSRGVSLSTDKGGSWTNFYRTSPFGQDNISALSYNKFD
ncbi:MAG: hypothetical protein OQK57_07720, partial [Ignavibacteriaceae bacterium]|nr:hypothetical protein [Ignavibacteriaceae bacterium]